MDAQTVIAVCELLLVVIGIVGMASSRRREEAVKSWRRSPGAAERENGGFLATLGLSNAERSAANEAMIAEIPEVAFF